MSKIAFAEFSVKNCESISQLISCAVDVSSLFMHNSKIVLRRQKVMGQDLDSEKCYSRNLVLSAFEESVTVCLLAFGFERTPLRITVNTICETLLES